MQLLFFVLPLLILWRHATIGAAFVGHFDKIPKNDVATVVWEVTGQALFLAVREASKPLKQLASITVSCRTFASELQTNIPRAYKLQAWGFDVRPLSLLFTPLRGRVRPHPGFIRKMFRLIMADPCQGACPAFDWGTQEIQCCRIFAECWIGWLLHCLWRSWLTCFVLRYVLHGQSPMLDHSPEGVNPDPCAPPSLDLCFADFIFFVSGYSRLTAVPFVL